MLATLKFLARDESAVALVEYGILIAFIALFLVVGLTFLGSRVSDIYDRAGDHLQLP